MPSQTDRNGASFRDLRFVCSALLPVFLPAAYVKNIVAVKDSRFGAVASPVKLGFPPQQLTEIGTTQLHTMIDAAELADLRWPKFVKYRTEVRDFYDSCDGALPWMRELRPTSQALAIIQLLRTADREGLNPEDYDGPRWDGRIRALEQSNPVPESDLVRFDLALTVSAMRYVSDVHLGRVNPRRFPFELDIDHTNLDLSEFLRQRLVGASDEDIATAIEAVEPPIPTYHRTLNAFRTYLELARRDDGELLPVPRKAIRAGDSSYTGLLRLRKLLVL